MPEQNGTARTIRHEHSHQYPPRVRLHPADNGKNWLIGVCVVIAVLAVLYALSKTPASKASTSKPVPVTNTDSKPQSVPVMVKDEQPQSKEGKSSNNSGHHNNNITIEGNGNKVIIGERHTHYHSHVHPTTTVKETTVVVVQTSSRPVERVVTPEPDNTRKVSEECEELDRQHQERVAVWRAKFVK